MTVTADELPAARAAEFARARAAANHIAELAVRLRACVTEAGARARTSGRPVLASVVAPAPPVDPLDGLAALAEAAAEAVDDPAADGGVDGGARVLGAAE